MAHGTMAHGTMAPWLTCHCIIRTIHGLHVHAQCSSIVIIKKTFTKYRKLNISERLIT